MESPGTYTIAALFAGGRRNSTALNSECSLMLDTPQYNRHAIEQAEALITAIEFVNERQLLPPNVTLGYEIWDTCSRFPEAVSTLRECSVPEYRENIITSKKPLVTILGPSYNTRDLERSDLRGDIEDVAVRLTDAKEAITMGQFRGIFFLTDQPPLQDDIQNTELIQTYNNAVKLELRCQMQALAAAQYAIRTKNSNNINVVSSGDICGQVFLEEFVSKAGNYSFKCYQDNNTFASSTYQMGSSQCTVFDVPRQTNEWMAEKEYLCKGFIILIANTEFVHEFLEIYVSDNGLNCEKTEYSFLIGQLWGDPSYYPSIEKSIVKLIEKGVEVRGLQYHVGSSECIQNHMTSLRADSAELERNCWLRDYWEQNFECSIQRRTCNLTDSLNGWSSILSRNYKAGLIMDSVMMLVEYIKAQTPHVTDFQRFSGDVSDRPSNFILYNNQTGALVHTLSNKRSCIGANYAFLQPKRWQFDIFNFSTRTNQLQSNQIGYLYYDCGNEDSQWRYENNSEASQSETVSCSFATPVVSRSDMCLCDEPTTSAPTTAPSCQDNSLVVLPLLFATAAAVLFIFYVYQKRQASLVSISLHDLPIVLSTDALFSIIIAILSSVGVLEPLDCDDYILDSLIQIGNSICFSWLFISLLTSMMTSRLVTICLKGPGFCVLLGIQIALSVAANTTSSSSSSLKGLCIEDRQSALSVLAYWYSALVLLALLLLFLVHTAREHRKTWNREYLAVLFVGGCLIGYCVLLSTLLWQDTCVGLMVSVVMLASTPAIALIIAVALMLAKMNQAAISDDQGPLDRAVRILLHERHSFSGELPTGLEIALEDDLKDKIDKAFINPAQIKSQHRIGKGNFGFVFKGQWKDELVAIKTVQDFDSDSAVNAFIKEAIIMTTFKHPNVMNMLGISKLSFGSFLPPSPVILLPYMELGDLKTLLRKSRARSSQSASTSGSGESNTTFLAKPLSSVDQLNFGRQIAKGMVYLGAKKVIHRDLAARNCMIDYNLRVKVSDFGLARVADNYQLKVEDPSKRAMRLPYRWMSVEAIKDLLFTKESDVWAFGVTLWEIMTKAEVPYAVMSIKEMVNELMKGYRLERPYDCQRSVYDIMLRCWKQKPHERPTFSELIDLLDKEIAIFGPEYTLFDDEDS
ncbi:uncharacterized protein [Oscarella lobularis]|uniref:uncharacterized protein isoform X2 n=1 Tax=Oscarella lobularis TaxID=121494 RepID=UPI0033137D3C